MREIVYIQAGTTANYVGTHFWNTQESYFTYGDEDSIVRHEISFREGLVRGEPTLCPRLLAFDRKANFGTLTRNSGHEDEGDAVLWHGSTVQHKQDPVAKSEYHHLMDEAVVVPAENINDSSIRYWSDFSRVFFSSRSIQILPDIADWEATTGDWSAGQAAFRRFDEENALMEESLRLFIEECDNFQGLQVTQDTSTFGSFISSMLSSFRDEYSKNAIVNFALMTGAHPLHISVHSSYQEVREVVNDALCLRDFNEFPNATIPICHPKDWPGGPWEKGLVYDREKIYHTSAIISAHIESATLPLRLKRTSHDLSSFSTRLSWSGGRFGQLSGIFMSLPVSTRVFQDVLNFSTLSARHQTVFTRGDVVRGFTDRDIQVYEEWNQSLSLHEPFYSRTLTAAYPLPTSFPRIFEEAPPRPGSTPVFSSVTAGSASADFISNYARVIGDFSTKKKGVMIGLEDDELKELANELWAIGDSYLGDERDCMQVDILGEDEM